MRPECQRARREHGIVPEQNRRGDDVIVIDDDDDRPYQLVLHQPPVLPPRPAAPPCAQRWSLLLLFLAIAGAAAYLVHAIVRLDAELAATTVKELDHAKRAESLAIAVHVLEQAARVDSLVRQALVILLWSISARARREAVAHAESLQAQAHMRHLMLGTLVQALAERRRVVGALAREAEVRLRMTQLTQAAAEAVGQARRAQVSMATVFAVAGTAAARLELNVKIRHLEAITRELTDSPPLVATISTAWMALPSPLAIPEIGPVTPMKTTAPTVTLNKSSSNQRIDTTFICIFSHAAAALLVLISCALVYQRECQHSTAVERAQSVATQVRRQPSEPS